MSTSGAIAIVGGKARLSLVVGIASGNHTCLIPDGAELAIYIHARRLEGVAK